MALDHFRDHSLNAVDHPLDIDTDHLINTRFREVLDSPRAEDACIVDQYVNPAELPKSLLDHCEHFVSIGNISLDGDGLSPGSANILHYRVGSFTALRKVHNHRRAFPSQDLRGCSPNTAGCTGHEGHLPIKSSAHTDTPPSLVTSIRPWSASVS